MCCSLRGQTTALHVKRSQGSRPRACSLANRDAWMTNRALFLRALDLLAALRLVVLVDDRDVLLPRAAVDGLLSAVARADRVVAGAAAVGVHPRAAVQRVVAAGPVELVVALAAVERVVAVRACCRV